MKSAPLSLRRDRWDGTEIANAFARGIGRVWGFRKITGETNGDIPGRRPRLNAARHRPETLRTINLVGILFPDYWSKAGPVHEFLCRLAIERLPGPGLSFGDIDRRDFLIGNAIGHHYLDIVISPAIVFRQCNKTRKSEGIHTEQHTGYCTDASNSHNLPV